MCHVLDYGLDKMEGTSDDLLITRCFLSQCHYNEYKDPGGQYPDWNHKKDRAVIDAGAAHPVGGGVYAGHEDCLECHTGFAHNRYSTEDRRGACLKDDVAGCHDDPTEKVRPYLEPHTTEFCFKPGCHAEAPFRPHNAQMIFLYVVNTGTAPCEIARVAVDGMDVQFEVVPLGDDWQASLKLEPGQKVALQIFGVRALPGRVYEFEVFTTTGVSSGRTSFIAS